MNDFARLRGVEDQHFWGSSADWSIPTTHSLRW